MVLGIKSLTIYTIYNKVLNNKATVLLIKLESLRFQPIEYHTINSNITIKYFQVNMV